MYHRFGVRTLKRDGSEKGYSLLSHLIFALPKCYGTPTTIKSENARTEEN